MNNYNSIIANSLDFKFEVIFEDFKCKNENIKNDISESEEYIEVKEAKYALFYLTGKKIKKKEFLKLIFKLNQKEEEDLIEETEFIEKSEFKMIFDFYNKNYNSNLDLIFEFYNNLRIDKEDKTKLKTLNCLEFKNKIKEFYPKINDNLIENCFKILLAKKSNSSNSEISYSDLEQLLNLKV